MLCHLLLTHPLFEEKPLTDVLEPSGFDVSVEHLELPCEIEQQADAAVYAQDPASYIRKLFVEHPSNFTEVYRGETEDCEVLSVAVRPKTVCAQLLLDIGCAESSRTHNRASLDVFHERMRERCDVEFSKERDDNYVEGELAAAAASYALFTSYQAKGLVRGIPINISTQEPLVTWPWARKWWKPSVDPRRNLVVAGALILAEIERLDRAAERQQGAA